MEDSCAWESIRVLEIDGTISRVRGQYHSYSEVTAENGTKLTDLLRRAELSKHDIVTARVVYAYGEEEVRTGRISVRMVDTDTDVTYMAAIDTALWVHTGNQVQIVITRVVPRGANGSAPSDQERGWAVGDSTP